MNEISSKDRKRVERAERIFEQTVCGIVNNKDLSEKGTHLNNRFILQSQDRLDCLIRDCESQAAKDSIAAYVDKLEQLVVY